MVFFKTHSPGVTEAPTEAPADERQVAQDGSLHYTVDEGINNAKVTYQEASGAPVETKSPLGYSVGWMTVLCLNVSMMVGTGVFSTRK